MTFEARRRGTPALKMLHAMLSRIASALAYKMGSMQSSTCPSMIPVVILGASACRLSQGNKSYSSVRRAEQGAMKPAHTAQVLPADACDPSPEIHQTGPSSPFIPKALTKSEEGIQRDAEWVASSASQGNCPAGERGNPSRWAPYLPIKEACPAVW